MNSPHSPHSGQPIDISWAGKGTDYIGLGFKIFFLKIITLGIYHFWGKTETRRKLWNQTRINSEPLEYTGTGMELFLGFLLAMLVVFVPVFLGVIAIVTIFGQQSPLLGVFMALVYIFFLYLVGVAIYSANRYRISRTQWRGIRGALKGSAWGYGWTSFWTSIVTIFSLGLAVPWQSIKLQRIITNNTHFGETPMHFTGKASEIFKYFILPWLVMVGGLVVLGFLLMPYFMQIQSWQQAGGIVDPTKMFKVQMIILAHYFGFVVFAAIAYAWYQSKYYNYIAEKTHFSNGAFNLTTTPGGLIWLTISNLLIVLLSLTILTPVAIARVFGYIVDNLSFNGTVDIAAIQQSQQELSKTGEGLAEGFDIGSF